MWWILVIIVAVIGIGLSVALLADAPGRREAAGQTFSPMDFNHLRDGKYIGEYQGTKSHLRDTKVEVVVDKGMVSDVRILKGAIDKNGQPVKLTGGRSVPDLFETALQSQTLEVDVISGATITSKTHLKALEHALSQAQMQ